MPADGIADGNVEPLDGPPHFESSTPSPIQTTHRSDTVPKGLDAACQSSRKHVPSNPDVRPPPIMSPIMTPSITGYKSAILWTIGWIGQLYQLDVIMGYKSATPSEQFVESVIYIKLMWSWDINPPPPLSHMLNGLFTSKRSAAEKRQGCSEHVLPKTKQPLLPEQEWVQRAAYKPSSKIWSAMFGSLLKTVWKHQWSWNKLQKEENMHSIYHCKFRIGFHFEISFCGVL